MIAGFHRCKAHVARGGRVSTVVCDAQASETLILGSRARKVEVIIVFCRKFAQIGFDLERVRRCGGHGWWCSLVPGLFVGHNGGLRAIK